MDSSLLLQSSPTCGIARANLIQALITLDFWPEDRERLLPAWDDLLDSLRLGHWIKDPTRGE